MDYQETNREDFNMEQDAQEAAIPAGAEIPVDRKSVV